MNSKQFDELIARLADAPSRRDAFKGIAGGTLAAVGLTAGASAKKKRKGRAGAEKKKGKERVGAEACIPTGKKCPAPKPRGRKKKRKRLSCNKCCQRASRVGNDGKTRCSCKLDGASTNGAAYCCSGFMSAGRCAAYGN